MKKFYNTPAVLIRAYEISENISVSAPENEFIAPGADGRNDDLTVDFEMPGN